MQQQLKKDNSIWIAFEIPFELGKPHSRVSTWSIEQAGNAEVQGFQGGENIYFHATLNTKTEKLDTTPASHL